MNANLLLSDETTFRLASTMLHFLWQGAILGGLAWGILHVLAIGRAGSIRDLLRAAVVPGHGPDSDIRRPVSQCTPNAGSHSSQDTFCCFIESSLLARRNRRGFHRCEAQHFVDTNPVGEPPSVVAGGDLGCRGIRPWRQAHRERRRHLEHHSRATASFG